MADLLLVLILVTALGGAVIYGAARAVYYLALVLVYLAMQAAGLIERRLER